MPNPGHTVTPQTGPDAGTARPVDHESGIIEGIKGLIKHHMGGGKAPGGTSESGKVESTDEAVDRMSQAIKTVPGNTTDYG